MERRAATSAYPSNRDDVRTGTARCRRSISSHVPLVFSPCLKNRRSPVWPQQRVLSHNHKNGAGNGDTKRNVAGPVEATRIHSGCQECHDVDQKIAAPEYTSIPILPGLCLAGTINSDRRAGRDEEVTERHTHQSEHQVKDTPASKRPSRHQRRRAPRKREPRISSR